MRQNEEVLAQTPFATHWPMEKVQVEAELRSSIGRAQGNRPQINGMSGDNDVKEEIPWRDWKTP
jgi:hypothetical protein